MIKDIKYNGYTAQPSDYECSDGQLATSLNLISEDSQLKPLLQPIPTSIGLSASQKAVYIHGTSAYKHYILWKEKRLVGSTTQPMEIRPQHQLSYALSPGLIFISSALLVIPCSFSVLTVCTISFGKVTRPAICISAPPCPNVHFRLVCKVK